MTLRELTIIDFLKETAGSNPVPGGGSISALNGAISSALAEMVANLTIGKKKYEEVEGLMQQVAKECDDIRRELILDIDRDSEAYDEVFAAFKLPKDTEEEKSYRSRVIQEKTIKAAEIPMTVARRVHSLLRPIEDVACQGNQNAVTDACVAMMCARTAIIGALLNVRINLTSIKDEDIRSNMKEEADRLEADAIKREAKVLEWIKTVL